MVVLRIILVGFGSVGQNFAKNIYQNFGNIFADFGFYPKLVAVVDRGGAAINPKGLNIERILSVKRKKQTVGLDPEFGVVDAKASEVIENVDSEIVVEATPTNVIDGEPGLSHIEAALKRGKHVITCNKGPLALALPALIELAEHNRVFLKFSGTVGGGTPILNFAKKCLKGSSIETVRGVLNGTTNYILTRMETGVPFEEALKEAQMKGYAEEDPSYDVCGIDTACKLVILANYVLGLEVTLKNVQINGITKVTYEQIEEANKRGRAVRLIGSISKKKLKVSPEEIPRLHPLCVQGILNAVTFETNECGEQTIIGRGAGGLETSIAILRDLIDIRDSLSKGFDFNGRG